MSLQWETDWQILEGAKIGAQQAAHKPRIAESSRAMTITEDRYRSLLGASSALAGQPTVKAVLQSLRGVLSSTSRLHGAELYVLSDDGESLYSFEFDRDPDAPAIKRGAKLLRIGRVAQVLDEQKPVFVPDLSPEMLEHPDLAPFAAEVAGRSAYLFPVSTAQKRYGILSTPKLQGQQFAPEDVEMLSALASHVAVALECAAGKRHGGALPPRGREAARSARIVARNQQSYRQ